MFKPLSCKFAWILSCSGKLSDRSGEVALLCLSCEMCGLNVCVCGEYFPQLTVSSLHLLHCLRLNLADGYYLFLSFFFSVFFSTIQQALYQQHRQTLEWTLSAGSFPHCGHCSPPMDNGFPAQGGMLEMSVRKRAEQDVVSVGPLCSFSANLVKTTLGQQTRMHTPSLPHSTCLSY